jgi:hypothetical protein
MSIPSDPARRRAALVVTKLAALVREHAAATPVEPAGFAGGAGVLAGSEAWVLFDERPERGLGPAVAWALRHDATSLHVLADRGTGTLARRAGAFGLPIVVHHVEGRALVPAIAEPLIPPPPASEAHRAFAAVIVAGGAIPVEEHGVVAGEVAGLEVCRVVDDPVSGEARLDVGVGAHDREMFQMLHGDRPAVEALAEVVATVARHRVPGAPPHPLNQLGASRLLRDLVIRRPEAVGADVLVAAAPPLPRPNLKDELPCVAEGVVDGRRVLVVCSTGVDLDLVPFSVDAAAALATAGRPVTECLLIVPSRDALPIQQRIAALAAPPSRLVPVDVAALVATGAPGPA